MFRLRRLSVAMAFGIEIVPNAELPLPNHGTHSTAAFAAPLAPSTAPFTASWTSSDCA